MPGPIAPTRLLGRTTGQVLGLKADRAGNGDVGIELGFGNADPRRLCRGLPLGLPHVGPAPQQLGRNSHDDLLRRSRESSRET